MTKHERDFVPDSPPIDAAAVSVEKVEITELDPEFDVAQVATRGHVLMARCEAVAKVGFWPALAVGVVAGFFVFKASYAPALVTPPTFLKNALTYNEETYFDLGGGLRGPSALAWMADYAPTPESLSQSDYDALVAALKTDLSAHGIEIADWEAIGALKKAPKITSPARLFADFKDRVKDGAVVVDKDNQIVFVAAYVEGRWALTDVRPSRCQTVLGPVAKDCVDGTNPEGWTRQAVQILASLKPAGKE